MNFDLIVRGGVLPDGTIADIGIIGETIAAIEPELNVTAGTAIDAHGNLVSPPFVDPHFHMDATLSLESRASTRLARCWKAFRFGAN